MKARKYLFILALVILIHGCIAQPGMSQTTDPSPQAAYSVLDLLNIAMGENPNLQQAHLEIQSAQGKVVQSGLYPNPVASFTADELGDRTGPAGILSPQISQEFILGGKRQLNQAIACREVDQATLVLQSQRFSLITSVRQGFFEVLVSQRRVQILRELVKSAQKSQDTSETLLKAKQIAEIDVLPLQLETHRLTADLEAAEREWIASWQKLAASIGTPKLPMNSLVGQLEEELPAYDFEKIRDFVLENHPDVQAARVGIQKAEFTLRRAEVEKIPNVTLSTGYVRQSQNRSNDWMLGISMPLPVFNRNQGNVLTAQADMGKARFEVIRSQNDLASRLSIAYGQYSAAKKRAEKYKTHILPTANKSFDLSTKAFKGGQFEYLRVIQAQRAISEAKLEYIRALGDAWRAASELRGLLLEEERPNEPTQTKGKQQIVSIID